ncbi:MAG: sigma-70 family RNA polymerase sigma factor [Bryobacteraceae bacterium]|nr:sigma-70 family RNA polymerase sigma factor [Bryobacteraceae bacterium]
MDAEETEITALLAQAGGRSPQAAERLYELVYAELRRIARIHMGRERQNTLQPTALVNEAYLRLAKDDRTWRNRGHFYNVAAQAMRRILVDRARAKLAQKRGAGAHQIEIPDFTAPYVDAEKMLALDEALLRLSRLDARQCRVVELRFFGGMTEEEIAEYLDVSVRTVKRDWNVARAWLYQQIGR